MRVEGREGGVFSCEVEVSSSLVWGWEGAVCEPHPYTPAGVSALAPEVALHTAAPPAAHSVAREDCSSLEEEQRHNIIMSMHSTCIGASHRET